MKGCPECNRRAQLEAHDKEEIEHLRLVNRTLKAEVVLREGKHEEVTRLLLGVLTEEV